MTSKCVILLCYWGGNICDGPEGVCYNKPPSKAIKVQPGIKFNELINQLHVATSIDKQKNCVKVICRYPSGFGKMMKYIPVPITDDDDIEIMFQVLNVYQELNTVDLYLEVETERHTKIARRTQKRSLIEKDASLPHEISKEKDASLPTNVLYEDCYIPEESSLIDNDVSLPHDLSKESTNEFLANEFLATNVVSKMTENEDFNTISQIAVVNNEMSSGFEANDDYRDDDETEDGDGTRDDQDIIVDNGTCETPHVDGQYVNSNKQVPSCFTSLEGIEKACRAGSQNQVRKFNLIMEEIGNLNPKAREWLEGHPLSKWTLAHDGGKRYGMLTTNMSEIFNSVLKGARYLPITACVQLTFYRVVRYFNVRRSLGRFAQGHGNLYTTHVAAKLARWYWCIVNGELKLLR